MLVSENLEALNYDDMDKASWLLAFWLILFCIFEFLILKFCLPKDDCNFSYMYHHSECYFVVRGFQLG